MDDSCSTAKGFETHRVARVLHQDTANFKRQRVDIHTSRRSGEALGYYREAQIRYIHGVWTVI